MKHGSITWHLRRRNNQNHGLKGENELQRRRRQFHMLKKPWHQFLGYKSDNFDWLHRPTKFDETPDPGTRFWLLYPNPTSGLLHRFRLLRYPNLKVQKTLFFAIFGVKFHRELNFFSNNSLRNLKVPLLLSLDLDLAT